MVVIGILAGFISSRGGCQRPWPWQRAECVAMEEAILSATVRIVFNGSIELEDGYDTREIKGTISHATVIDGRYLLTHNHFGIPLSQIQIYNRYAQNSFTGVSVYKLDGSAVLDQVSLDSFTVVSEQGETVLLDFGTTAGEGVFTQAGLGSATAAAAGSKQLAPGMEVALIDWDGQGHTRVVWAEIETIYEDKGLSLMRVDHFIELGASGGGVFLDSQHIGNNWARVTESTLRTGQVIQQDTRVALNM